MTQFYEKLKDLLTVKEMIKDDVTYRYALDYSNSINTLVSLTLKRADENFKESNELVDELINVLANKNSTHLKFDFYKMHNFIEEVHHFTQRLHSLSPSVQEVIDFYKTCYETSKDYRLSYLLEEFKDEKDYFKAIFKLGENYTKDTDEENNEFREVMYALGNFQHKNSHPFSTDEVKELIYENFKNSQGIVNIPDNHIVLRVINALGENPDSNFIEKLLSDFKDYKPLTTTRSQNPISYFDIPTIAITVQYGFKNPDVLNDLMQEFQNGLMLYYKDLRVSTIMSQECNMNHQKFHRVFVESSTDKAADLDMIEDIFYELFRSYKNNVVAHDNEDYFKNDPKVFSDTVMFHKLHADMSKKVVKKPKLKI